MFRSLVFVVVALGLTSAAHSQTKMKVRDPISRKYQPQHGFFEKSKSHSRSIASPTYYSSPQRPVCGNNGVVTPQRSVSTNYRWPSRFR